MQNYKIVMAYDGSRYKGWQRLNENTLTVQGVLEDHLSKCFEEEILIVGSGRTDAGVHASNQVASFHSKKNLQPDHILKYLNHHLPSDLRIKSIERAADRFHARYNSKGKTYIYRMYNHKVMDPFRRKYCYHMPKELDVKAMKKAATYLVGEHDFQSYTTMKSKKKSTVRNLHDIKIHTVGDELHLEFTADGFLYNMVRIIVGTLLDVGLHQYKPEHVQVILDKKVRQEAGETAPPHGLFLDSVEYK